MDITRFLQKPNTPVPIPRDASLIQEQCIIAGNVAMQQLSGKKKERQRLTLQPRIKWTAEERFELGRLACQTSTANALNQAKLEHPMANEATIRNFSTAEHGKIEAKKRGKPLLFGEYDKLIVDYVRRLRKHGAVVNSRIVMGTARGIILRRAPQLLHDRGGTKKISRD